MVALLRLPLGHSEAPGARSTAVQSALLVLGYGDVLRALASSKSD